MDWKRQKLYVLYLTQELEFAAYSFAELREELRSFDLDEMTRRAHEFASHAASASRMLWPSTKQARSRGAMLRQILGIANDHPLACRRLRNTLEHFDERLDVHIEKWDGAGTIWQAFGADDTTMSTHWVVRNFQPASMTYSILGEDFDLKALWDAVQSVGNASYALLDERYRAGGGTLNLLRTFPQRRVLRG